MIAYVLVTGWAIRELMLMRAGILRRRTLKEDENALRLAQATVRDQKSHIERLREEKSSLEGLLADSTASRNHYLGKVKELEAARQLFEEQMAGYDVLSAAMEDPDIGRFFREGASEGIPNPYRLELDARAQQADGDGLTGRRLKTITDNGFLVAISPNYELAKAGIVQLRNLAEMCSDLALHYLETVRLVRAEGPSDFTGFLSAELAAARAAKGKC